MGIAELRSTHVHPVRTLRGLSPRQAVVEPWRPTGDRRRALIDDGGKVVTRRAQPRPAPAAAEPLSGGGIRLPAPGQAPPEMAVPEPVAANAGGRPWHTGPWHTGGGGSPGPATHAWCDDQLGTDIRHVRMGPGRPRRPARRGRARPPLRPRHPIDPAHALPGETMRLSAGCPLLITAQAPLAAGDSLMARDDHAAVDPLPVHLPRACSDFDSSDLRPRGNPRQRPGRWGREKFLRALAGVISLSLRPGSRVNGSGGGYHGAEGGGGRCERSAACGAGGAIRCAARPTWSKPGWPWWQCR
ncbi:MOSC N-terminal beta barrel domain-containing protein [Streptomyces sp. NPDC048254]|uniref:MOSC N-terminal beta barrel domain-containing protein n=1 Tax=Streptomyces sp. NPDC048254 TaxID=3365525 RepID=UPI00371C8508